VTLVANARMYAVNAVAASHWHKLLSWIGERADVALHLVDHAAPAALTELWHRDDLAAVTMCGYPLSSWQADARPVPIAAPCPRASRGDPTYRTDIVVRADSPYASDDDLAGARFGWTLVDSQSGYQAPRRHFAARALARGGRFFGSTVGPLLTPRRVVETLLGGDIDAGPLDSYWHALLNRHEPRTAARLRVIASTPPTPIPCFVSSAATAPALRERIALAFGEAAHAPEVRDMLDALELARFARVDTDVYGVLASQARATDALGYPQLR
jgi:ABC-type phosphate/phosphonate transport system substrate-binding protein